MEYIQGEKFMTITNDKIIYCHNHYVYRLFNNPPKHNFVLVSHNSDSRITNNPGNVGNGGGAYYPDWMDADIRNMPDNLIRWYAQNCEVENDRLESIPIGLENNYCNPLVKKIYNIEKINTIEKNHKNLVYLNLDINTNRNVRQTIYDMLCDKKYITCMRNKVSYEDYINDVYNHKFMICPEGNGIDVHQPWECLYVNTIPIQRKNINNKNWSELPICFVDEWEQLTDENFLNSEYDRITNSYFDKSKMDFNYWKNKILNTI